MQLISSAIDGAVAITVHSTRIDAPQAIQFKDQMRELTADVVGCIVLDLSQVDFVDSSGLGAIVASMKQLSDGQELELAALSPTVAKVFKLTRMDSVFTIHTDLDAAAGNIRKSG
ncbi:MAG: STAS domain-containing protein [Paracoccaceae bacterium]